MRIVIVRHGQSVANAQGRWQGQLDYELSVEGQTQAEKLKERFIMEKFTPDLIYSSPLKRALRTAEITFPEKKVFTIDDLKEGGAGVFEGKTMDELRIEHPEAVATFERTKTFNNVPESESRYDLRKRAKTAVDFFIKGHNRDDEIAVFTHSGTMMYIMAVIMGTSRVWSLRIPNTAVFDFRIDPNAWDTVDPIGGARQGAGSFEIRRFADASHLHIPQEASS
ncbi:MAG: histidine phosphatase family protein [SAR202 cluster bacterium]|jgi:broad specificity phosphatase PhoE|nr:MAG: histidine phosphatase family protein [SAR202 cluster bacterium]MCH2319421.1 histidine phosphatase family protein [SAR202 cluster bacterium]MQG75070.1 histidine phosphatase family protein [SAR202 cluster bacterium]|tara:strand:- start:1691 stop:2359 length:669 start_codon:yes stop_codon:yes gene_type:complete